MYFLPNLIKSKKDFCCCLSDIGIHTDNKLKTFTQRDLKKKKKIFGTDEIHSYCNMDLIWETGNIFYQTTNKLWPDMNFITILNNWVYRKTSSRGWSRTAFIVYIFSVWSEVFSFALYIVFCWLFSLLLNFYLFLFYLYNFIKWTHIFI